MSKLNRAKEFYSKFLEEYATASVKQSIEPYTTIMEKYKEKLIKEYADNAQAGFSRKMDFIKSYLNKETLKIVSDEDGDPVLEMEGLVLLHGHSNTYIQRADVYKSVTLHALYDKDKKACNVDYAHLGYASQPNVNEESKYIITNK